MIKESKGTRAVFAVVFVMFLVYAVTLIYPFVWTFFAALKTNTELYLGSPFALPEEWRFVNFLNALRELDIDGSGIGVMTLNSIWFSVGASAVSLTGSVMSSYVVARYRFAGRKIIYGISLFIMMVPIVGALPSQYKLYTTLNLINSPLFLVTYVGGFGFNFIVLYGFMKNISGSYVEAAFIDGAGHHRAFWQIVLPQVMPSVVALAIIQIVGLWNDYSTPLLYLKDFPTLSSGLYVYQTKMIASSDYPVYYAGILISMVPVLILFGAFQNTIMQNTYAGGLKG